MRAALVQLTSSDDPEANLPMVLRHVTAAADAGATLICTPEVTNCVSTSRTHQRAVLRREAEDPMLVALRDLAARRGVTVAIGSLALVADEAGEDRFVNRSFVIGASGELLARYDKIHMFDVQLTPEETYRESDGFRPGTRTALVRLPEATLGLTICYDLRFPHLHRALAQAGAEVLLQPAAFSPVSGARHWEVLLRARAIETGCYVLAAAQCGHHAATVGRRRRTHGHSLAVDPDGKVLADAGDAPGLTFVTLDMAEVGAARARIPSLSHDRPIPAPT